MSSGSSGVLNAARSSLRTCRRARRRPRARTGAPPRSARGHRRDHCTNASMPAAGDLRLLEQQPEEVRGVREEPALHVSHLQSGVASAPSMTHTGIVTSQASADRRARRASGRGASAARRRRRPPTTPPPGSCSPARPTTDAPSDDERGSGLADQPVERPQPVDAHADGAHDPPAADARAERERGRRQRAVTQSGALVPVECWVATSMTTITPVALAASFAP